MGFLEPPTRESQPPSSASRVLICAKDASSSFLQSGVPYPQNSLFELFKDSVAIFDRLWDDPEQVQTIILDRCAFDFEELYYASLNHTDVSFVVRSAELTDDVWYDRYARQPNIKLPCSDFMLWVYAFSSSSIET